MAQDELIVVKDLNKSFGKLHVLKDVNTSIRKGEVVAVIGPSGSGKSTFLRCLNLLETPSGGEILFHGQNISENGNIPAYRTKVGMAMRAVSKDFETSQLMGIKINNVISVTFIIGSFLAAVGSMLYFSNYPGVVPTSGAMPGLKAFVAAVFGGIGSIPGAVIGAFIIGVFESLIKGLDTILTTFHIIQSPLELSTFSDAFPFVLLIVILVFKPTGLFGEKATDKV